MPRDGAKRVAVMQPYLYPYAGYFRLCAAVDEFVIFDCVQFPRRGRVHRTEVPAPAGGTEWLTLPLERHDRDVLIRDLEFAADARARFDERLARHRWIEGSDGEAAERVRSHLLGPLDSVADFLERGLRLVADLLGFPVTFSRSSQLDLDPALRGQARVLSVAGAVGATHYLNAPGGRDLYDSDEFARSGIELSFLSPYHGEFHHLLPALLSEPMERVRADVLATLTAEPS